MSTTMAKKRGGRKPKPTSKLRREQVRVLLTTEEKQLIEAAAEFYDMNLGEYMRRVTLPHARKAQEKKRAKEGGE